MNNYLGLLLLAALVTGVLFVPFIDFLYKKKFIRAKETEEIRKGATANFYKIREMHSSKAGTPTGGGILVVGVVVVICAVAFFVYLSTTKLNTGYPVWAEILAILTTFGGYAALGFYDDVMKIFGYSKTGFFGLRLRHKLFLQFLVGAIAAGILYWVLGIDFVNLPYFGVVKLGWVYFPLSTVLIVGFANAFDFTDGLDGLSCGLLIICLLAFWFLSLVGLDSILGIFIAVWLGALTAFLYFNVYPARIMLGNMGGLAFGGTLAMVGLLSGKMVALVIIGGIFLVEGMSSLLQILSKRFMKHRLFPIAPFHHWLQLVGWEEPKIVARAWLAGIVLAIFGVWLAYL